ncbi:YT521-B-like domain-containing protein [Coprinopsis sp. MPI-PUGE-AT-0042]|nr:YT521-B-like domain-containing protein [Coprinopsis sp. MPI-PUGE-AT-0042]
MLYSPQLSPPPQYSYTGLFSASPAGYQPFGAMHYPAHTSSSAEMDGQTPQGSWYFVPHGRQPNVPFRPGYEYPYHPLGQHQDPSAHVSPISATAPLHQQRPFEIQNPSASPPPPPPPGPSHPSNGELAPSTPASSPPLSSAPKPIKRREWHPKPPPHRSPWVMWVGNVPSDATQEELWKFFTQIPGPSGTTDDSGVESIHLISRSNCAFINYSSEAAVSCAISTVNGLRLRPNDPQCPMLVCKIRRSMDDLQSGVGGQRGIGLHKQWVRDQRNKLSQPDTPSDDKDVPEHLVNALASVSLSPSERSRRGTHTSSSSSHASTSSSFLVEFFPTRYFILKSLSEDDLNLSVENGLWATQKHNELLLDQAFRTARDVFLIFSVNKSGEFYGYARMIGPIRHGEGSVNWVMRSQGHESPTRAMFRAKSACGVPNSPRPPIYFTPGEGHLVDVSPQGLDPTTPVLPPLLHSTNNPRSAPPKFGGPSTDDASYPPSLQYSLDRYERAQAKGDRFKLDPEAPARAVRNTSPDGESDSVGKENQGDPTGDASRNEYEHQAMNRPADAQWGECFKVEWLERRKIPFHRTRHLRNPWNKSREIKISRDGTELEPGVGAKLLEEWGALSEADPLVT